MSKHFGYVIIALITIALTTLSSEEFWEKLKDPIDQLYCYSIYDTCYTEALALNAPIKGGEQYIEEYIKFYKSGKLEIPDGTSFSQNQKSEVIIDSLVSIINYSIDSSYCKIRFFNPNYIGYPKVSEKYLTGFVPTSLLHRNSIKSSLDMYDYCGPIINYAGDREKILKLRKLINPYLN